MLVAAAWERRDLRVAAAVLVPFVATLVVYVAHDRYKFPPDTLAAHAAILATYAPAWFANPLLTVPLLLVSPGAGLAFFAPTTWLGVAGIREAGEDRVAFVRAVVLAAAGFFLFIALMRIFKGDPAWGPRYLTPLVLVSWLWAPDGFRSSSRRMGAGVVAAGVLVQLLAISVDPHRMMVERGMPNAWTAELPALLFHPATSHLFARPGEILEILTDDEHPRAFSPAPAPTASVPMAQQIGRTAEDVERYVILDELRPWWATYRHLPAEERPMPIAPTLAGLVALLLVGAALASLARQPDDGS